MIKARQILLEKLISLTGTHDYADQKIKKEENTDRGFTQIYRIPKEEHLGKVMDPIDRITKEGYIGSSR